MNYCSGGLAEARKHQSVQHPAPFLNCTLNRDEENLYVTAPYAVAVCNGKNITSERA